MAKQRKSNCAKLEHIPSLPVFVLKHFGLAFLAPWRLCLDREQERAAGPLANQLPTGPRGLAVL